MFKQTFVGTQKAVTLSATHPALPNLSQLRLRSENGSTDRANPLYGNMTVAHSTTKELGGGFRHVLRNNLREHGDIKPASAYLVVINNDTVEGEVRAVQAIIGLISLLIQLHEDITIAGTDANGIPNLFTIGESVEQGWPELFSSSAFSEGLQRFVGRES